MEDKARNDFYNILAFPGFGQESLFQIRGCHYWPNLEASLVYEIEIDYDRVVRHWLGEEVIDVQYELSSILERINQLDPDILVPAEAD